MSIAPAIRRPLRRRAVLAALAVALIWLPGVVVAAPVQPSAASGGDPCADGVRLFKAHDLAAAEPLLRRCVADRPDPVALAALAAIASLAKRPAEAGDLAARAVDLDSASVDARYWLGRALLEQGDRAGAQREWDRALRFSTEHPGVLEGLARLAIDRGETAKAYGLLSELVRTGQAQGWTHRLLADLARRKRLWGDALRHWRDAMGVDGEDAASLLTAGELAILASDTTAALDVCRRAVAIEPTGPAYGGLGEALFAARRYEEAEAALRKAVELDPGSPRHRFNLANVLEVLDRPDEAEVHFRSYIELQPADAIGRFNYGVHLDKLGRKLEALEQVETAVRLSPQMLTAQVVRGQLLEDLGRLPEALAAIDTLTARDPENAPRLGAWRESVLAKQAAEADAQRQGLVHLLHIVTADTAAVRLIARELRAGVDFGLVATRFSSGPTAAQGGDIGRVAPADLVEPLRTAVSALAIDAQTPPLETRGLWHFFKRVR